MALSSCFLAQICVDGWPFFWLQRLLATIMHEMNSIYEKLWIDIGNNMWLGAVENCLGEILLCGLLWLSCSQMIEHQQSMEFCNFLQQHSTALWHFHNIVSKIFSYFRSDQRYLLLATLQAAIRKAKSHSWESKIVSCKINAIKVLFCSHFYLPVISYLI